MLPEAGNDYGQLENALPGDGGRFQFELDVTVGPHDRGALSPEAPNRLDSGGVNSQQLAEVQDERSTPLTGPPKLGHLNVTETAGQTYDASVTFFR